MFTALFLICSLQYGLQEEEYHQVTEEDQLHQFREWKSQLGKRFSSQDEEDYRFRVFEANNNLIKSHNALKDRTYTMALNQFSDLTQEEFKSVYLSGFIPDQNDDKAHSVNQKNDFILHKHRYHEGKTNYNQSKGSEFLSLKSVPEQFDSRDHGWIGPIKDQGSCGSCWAFSTVSAIEAELAVRGRSGYDLSEQQIVDCAKKGGDGCQGGRMEQAFQYLQYSGGITEEKIYPYTGTFGQCRIPYTSYGIRIFGFQFICRSEQSCLESIRYGVMMHGSLTIVFDALPWRFYSSGILKLQPSEHGKPNHAVNVIGWGSENGQEYLTIRNTWGTGFGEQGYLRIDVSNCVEDDIWREVFSPILN